MAAHAVDFDWPDSVGEMIGHLDQSDRDLFDRIKRALPLLADVTRGNVLLYASSERPGEAVVIAEAVPHTVPSLYDGSRIGLTVQRESEPAVARAIGRGVDGRLDRSIDSTASHPTIQDVYPVRRGERVIGALAVELSLLEGMRQKRKDAAYRRAIDLLRRTVAAGQLKGAENITPLGEHDGALLIHESERIAYISTLAEQLYRKAGYNRSLLNARVCNVGSDEAAFYRALGSDTCVEHVVEENGITLLKKAIPIGGRRPERLFQRVLPTFEVPRMVMVYVHDLTEERQKQRELTIKSAMIQEIHHRVKNNLQTIAALLRLQARRTGSPEVAEMLQESINRILSIAVVHDFLAHDESNEVDLHEVLQRIIVEVKRSIVDPQKQIRLVLEGDHLKLTTQQATPCALVVNELLQNAVEHGFEDRADGQVRVRMAMEGKDVVIQLDDDGRGLSDDFQLAHQQSLGLQIVRTLIGEDLKGKFQLTKAGERGTRAVVRFPRAQLS